MFPSDYEKLSYLSALGLYGVFSHFIHPDDLFDEERGRGQTWDVLFDSYSEMIGEIHASYPFLRSLSVSEAADALFVCQEATPLWTIRRTPFTEAWSIFMEKSFSI